MSIINSIIIYILIIILLSAARDCSNEDGDCKIHNGEYGYCKEFEIFNSIDFFELDDVKLVKINHYGDEVWASDFEICFDEE